MSEYTLKDYYNVLSGQETTEKYNNKKISLHFITHERFIGVSWRYKKVSIIQVFNIDEYHDTFTIYDFYNMIVELGNEYHLELLSQKEKNKEYKRNSKQIRKVLKLSEASIYDIPHERNIYDAIQEKMKENE